MGTAGNYKIYSGPDRAGSGGTAGTAGSRKVKFRAPLAALLAARGGTGELAQANQIPEKTSKIGVQYKASRYQSPS